MPRTIPEWLAALAVLLSAGWLYAKPDFEPGIVLITSILTFTGLRGRGHVSRSWGRTTADSAAQFDVRSLLKGAYQADRLQVAKENLSHITAIAPQEFASVLGLFYQADRLAALKTLAEKLAGHPTPSETEAILGTLYATDRPAGAKALVAQVASNISMQRTPEGAADLKR